MNIDFDKNILCETEKIDELNSFKIEKLDFILNNSYVKNFIEVFGICKGDIFAYGVEKMFKFFIKTTEKFDNLREDLIFLKGKLKLSKSDFFYTYEYTGGRNYFLVDILLGYKKLGKEKFEKLYDYISVIFCDTDKEYNLEKFCLAFRNEDIDLVIDFFIKKFGKIDESYKGDKNFIYDFLDLLSSFKLENIFLFEDIEEIEKNLDYFLMLANIEIPKDILDAQEEIGMSKKELKNFLNKWFFSSDYYTLLLTKDTLSEFDLKDFFVYLLKYKKKSFIYYYEILDFSYKNNIYLNYYIFKEFENILQDFDLIKLKNFFRGFDIPEKNGKQLENALKHKNLDKVREIFGEIILEDIKQKYKKGIIEKVYERLDIPVKYDKINDDNFLETCKICLTARFNNKEGFVILKKFLEGKFENKEKLENFNTPSNRRWLKETLSKEQQKIWLSKNTEIMEINKDSDYIFRYFYDKLNEAKYKCEENFRELNKMGFEFQTEFSNFSDLYYYIYMNLSKLMEIYRFIENGNSEYFTEIDKETISKNKEKIKNILQEFKEKNLFVYSNTEVINDFYEKNSNNIYPYLKKIIIEKELDPIKIMLMGNFVQGSCLSFYNINKNDYSAISATCDVNKGVYYIYDENKKMLARVLVTIGDDLKLTRYNMYFSKEKIPELNYYFNQYFKKLAEKMQIEINGDQNEVLNIECKKWFKDGEFIVT